MDRKELEKDVKALKKEKPDASRAEILSAMLEKARPTPRTGSAGRDALTKLGRNPEAAEKAAASKKTEKLPTRGPRRGRRPAYTAALLAVGERS